MSGVSALKPFGVVKRLGYLLVAFLSLVTRSDAQVEVRYIDTEAWRLTEDQSRVIVRGAFEIIGQPQRWYHVYFQLRRDAETAFKDKDGKDFVRRWGEIFTPENVNMARYTDCRIGLPVAEIGSSPDLLWGKRMTLWAVCDVWDVEAKKYLGGGWPVRTPVLVTTDGVGNVQNVEFFYTPPFATYLKRNHASETIAAKECALDLEHLTLKKGTGVARAVGQKHEVYDVLFSLTDGVQTEVRLSERGYFFGTINAPDQARELAQLAYPKSVIINTPNQYRAIVAALKNIGWTDQHIPVAEPKSYGVTVQEEPDLGYRVTMLLMDYNRYLAGFQDVLLCEFCIAHDGRMDAEETVCIKGPESETSRPPGWTQPLPAGTAKYTDTIKAALLATETETIPNYVIVKDKKTRIPCRTDREPGGYLEKVEDWPASANE